VNTWIFYLNISFCIFINWSSSKNNSKLLKILKILFITFYKLYKKFFLIRCCKFLYHVALITYNICQLIFVTETKRNNNILRRNNNNGIFRDIIYRSHNRTILSQCILEVNRVKILIWKCRSYNFLNYKLTLYIYKSKTILLL